MLPLFQDSLDALTSQKRHPGCDLIFHDNGEILTYRQIQYVYELAFKRARLPFRGTHVLRHTGATLFQSLSEGDRLALQFLGGWKTSRQPEHYAKIISSVGRKAIDKIEQKGKLVLLKTE
jgi:integrase